MSEKNGRGRTLTRREALAISARFGATVASVGAAYMLTGGTRSFAQTAMSEAEKKDKADHILTMGLDGKLELFPDRPVTPESTWIFGTPQYKEAIETGSEGRIYVDLHDAGALGSQTAALKKVQQGVIQGCSCSTQNAAQLAPIWNVIDVPYTVGPVENAWKLIFSKEFNDTVRAESRSRRLMVAYIMPYLRWLEMSITVDNDVLKPEDLDGMKMRVTGSELEQAAFGILPANPTPIAWAEVYSALKDGAVDGIHVTPTSVYDGGMEPVIGQIVDTMWMYNNDSIWLDNRWVEGLADDLQEVVMQANFEAQKRIYDNYEAIHREAIGTTPNGPEVGWKAGDTRIIHLTDEQRQAWQDYLSVERNADVYDPLIDKFGRESYETVLEVVKSGSPEPRPWWTT